MEVHSFSKIVRFFFPFCGRGGGGGGVLACVVLRLHFLKGLSVL